MYSELQTLAKSCFKRFTLKELKTLFEIRKIFRDKHLRPEMVTLTYIGSAGAIWIVPDLIMMKNKEYRFGGVLVLSGIAIDVLFNNIVTKFVFHRLRPWTHYLDLYTHNSLSLGYSFPSGHALANSTAATIFILVDKRNAIWALPLAGSISFSRLFLFAHYPSDVLFGILDGVLAGVLTYKIGYKLKDEGRLKRIEAVTDNDYFFEYSNFFKHPIEYVEKLFKTLFGKEANYEQS